MSKDTPHSAGPNRGQHLYFAAWRRHFYAGLFVAPFLVMLALTGPALSPSVQAQAALATVSGGAVATYIAPASPTRPTFVEITAQATFAVAVNPRTGKVLAGKTEQTRGLSGRKTFTAPC